MLQMTKDQHARFVEGIGPWHHCYEFPDGVRTGDSAPNLFPYKMDNMIAGGAFARPSYPEALDLGSNAGYIAKWLVEAKASHVVAIEAGEKFWLQLKHVISVFGLESRIEARNDRIEACTFTVGGPYDLIIFLGTLHHIGRLHHEKIFDACYDCLKPGGEFVVQTKREEDVPGKMAAAGFVDVRQVYWSDEQDRGCWQGGKS
jgi:tRNA1(Val) A37 N6-methylase TrmN6